MSAAARRFAPTEKKSVTNRRPPAPILTMATLRTAGALALGALVGCYSGVSEQGPSAADDGGEGGSGAADDGADDGADGGSDDGAALGCEGAVDVGPTPLRRLTRREYANAVADLLGVQADVASLDPDEKLAAFDSNLAAPVSPGIVRQYRALAEDVASAAVVDLAALVPCDPAGVAADPIAASACTEAFVGSFGRRAFRRPLTAAEIASYAGLAEGGTDFTDGIGLAIAGMLQSVHFLYHLELAPPDTVGEIAALDDHQLAARLSFFLWGSVPDDELLDAADEGALQDPERLRAEAERMLDSERAADAVQSFHLQWLDIAEPDAVIKEADVYPAWGEPLRAAIWEETRRFVAHVVLEGDGRLATLMTSSESFADGPLLDLYGVTPDPDRDPSEPVLLDPNERAGLLTQASFLATHAHTNSSGPIQRGVVVRGNMLCQPPPPPPNEVPELGPVDPNGTTRERFEQHSSDPACAGCHALIDGIGLAMENYDGIGRFRIEENGNTVDASGELLGTDVDGEYVGAVELAHKLAESETLSECVTLQWFRFAFGRGEAEEDDCTIEGLRTAFAQSDHDVRELMIAIVTSDAFRNMRID
jgi:hypothetical protein